MNNEPQGWFWHECSVGKRLAFHCPRCRLVVTQVPDPGVFHCGKLEKRPLLMLLLPTYRYQPTVRILKGTVQLPDGYLVENGWDD